MKYYQVFVDVIESERDNSFYCDVLNIRAADSSEAKVKALSLCENIECEEYHIYPIEEVDAIEI